MKRDKFLLAMLAATASPLFASPRCKKISLRDNTGFIVKAGEARSKKHFQLKGVNSNVIDVKISGDDTDGDLFVFEQTSLSQGKGTPLHIHPFQDEIFCVLDGEYYFQVGEAKHRLYKGDSIFLPRKVPHAWTQVSGKGKMNVIMQPAGKLKNFFYSLAALKNEPTKEEVIKIFAENDMTVVGPPLKII